MPDLDIDSNNICLLIGRVFRMQIASRLEIVVSKQIVPVWAWKLRAGGCILDKSFLGHEAL